MKPIPMLAVPLFAAALGVHAAIVTKMVDLDAPGAIEALQSQNPEHYARARAILATAKAAPRTDLARFIEVEFRASDVECIAWRVSDPPQLKVAFTLDSTRYSAVVVPQLPPARPVPLR
jgi:hypothetical protein